MRILLRSALITLAAVAASLAAGRLRAGPPLAPGAPWAVDRTSTIAYPNWLQVGPEIRPDLRNVLTSEAGRLQYWIRVPKGARGTIVLAVGEACHRQAGRRVMDVLINGRVSATRIDPIRAAGGQHRLAAVACPAEDRDGTGLLHVEIVPAAGSPDRVTLAAGLWWLADRRLTPEQAAKVLREDSGLRADLFIPSLPEIGALWGRFAEHVRTEDPKLDAMARSLFAKCVIGAVRFPRPPALPHRWLTGGGGYVGQWIWDAMFVANAYAPLDDDATIRDAFENYWHTIEHNPEAPKGSFRYGMVPCWLGPWPPEGFSQIPILGWGCKMVWRQTHDRRLAERCLPYLVLFDQWYSSERDVNGNGLIEYGAYKPSIGNPDMVQTARYETFDFHPTLDAMKLTPHPKRPGGGRWYGNVEGVEQTCFLLMHEEGIAELAEGLGKKELAQQYRQIIARRIKAIREKMWDPATGFFYSLDRDTGRRIPTRTIQGFLTLTCGAATKEQAAVLVRHLQDPKQWWPAYPVPTVAMDDPKFGAKAMWRGDMWPATTYLVACGLNRYGYHDVARRLAKRMRELIAKHGINERYNPLTGQPIGDPGVAMTCSTWLLLVQSLYGVQEDFRTIVVPPDAAGRRLRLGKLEVDYPTADCIRLRTAFPRQFRVIFPGRQMTGVLLVQCDDRMLEPVRVGRAGAAAVFDAAPGHTYTVVALYY